MVVVVFEGEAFEFVVYSGGADIGAVELADSRVFPRATGLFEVQERGKQFFIEGKGVD